MDVRPARGFDDAVRCLESRSTELWLLAVVFFGLGDLVTTSIGLSSGYLVEVGPLATRVVGEYGMASLVGLKLAGFAVCVALWRLEPGPGSVGVPLALATFGILVTGWNASLLLFTF